MRADYSATNDELELRLTPDTPLDAAFLEEMSKVESGSATVPIIRQDMVVVLRKSRRVPKEVFQHIYSNGLAARR